MKQDILQGRLPVTFDLAAELGSYVVQCKWNISYFCHCQSLVFSVGFAHSHTNYITVFISPADTERLLALLHVELLNIFCWLLHRPFEWMSGQDKRVILHGAIIQKPVIKVLKSLFHITTSRELLCFLINHVSIVYGLQLLARYASTVMFNEWR